LDRPGTAPYDRPRVPPRAETAPETIMQTLMRSLVLGAVLAAATFVLSMEAAGGDAKPTKLAALETESSLGVAYTISFWGIPFGHTDFDSKFRQETYSTSSHFETSGIVSVFWQAKIEASSSGQVAEHALAPAVYDSFYQRGTTNKERVKVTFTGDDPKVEADPPYDLTQNPVSTAQKKEALDPLSAVTLILAGIKADSTNPCGTVAPVFDGRRRYNIEFTYVKDEKPDIDTALGKGKAHLCEMRYHQIAGFKPKIMKEGKSFPTIYGWFADVPSPNAPNGHYVIALKIWASTGWGTIDATLAQLHINGADRTPKG
jgi:hypothetical protein